VLALRVGSIGEVARLSSRGDGIGFRYETAMVGASLVRFSQRAGLYTSISDASVVPIEEIVKPNCQRLDITTGGGDGVADQERSSGRHRKGLVV
jgi:hypothetical protein